jgi:hypothetical protein
MSLLLMYTLHTLQLLTMLSFWYAIFQFPELISIALAES